MAAPYVSDHTLFMRELLASNPDWVDEQRRGRAIWWERKTQDDIETFAKARKQVGYPYDVNFKQD